MLISALTIFLFRVKDQTVMILRIHLTVDLTSSQEKSWLAAHPTGIAALLILVIVVGSPVVKIKQSGPQHVLLINGPNVGYICPERFILKMNFSIEILNVMFTSKTLCLHFSKTVNL